MIGSITHNETDEADDLDCRGDHLGCAEGAHADDVEANTQDEENGAVH